MALVAAGIAVATGTTSVGASTRSLGVPGSVLKHKFSWGTFTLAPRIANELSSGKQLTIVLDNQGTSIPIFGQQQQAGTNAGCAYVQRVDHLNVRCRVMGPVSTDVTTQVAQLQTSLHSNTVDCLAVEAPAPNAFVGLLNSYVAAGIPTFTENADVASSHRFAFFAINELAGGTLNGEVTAKVMKSRSIMPDEVAEGSGNPTAPWAMARESGFEKGFKQVFPNAKFFNGPGTALPTGADFTTQEVESSVGPFLAAHSSVNLFFHTDQGVEGVADVIQQKGMTGKVFTSGYNVDKAILDAIQSGVILVTIDQGFDKQAAAAVEACGAYLKSGSLPAGAPLAYLTPIVVTKTGAFGSTSVTAEAGRLGMKV
jgi:ribose transport system substrate-binding protein